MYFQQRIAEKIDDTYFLKWFEILNRTIALRHFMIWHPYLCFITHIISCYVKGGEIPELQATIFSSYDDVILEAAHCKIVVSGIVNNQCKNCSF